MIPDKKRSKDLTTADLNHILMWSSLIRTSDRIWHASDVKLTDKIVELIRKKRRDSYLKRKSK